MHRYFITLGTIGLAGLVILHVAIHSADAAKSPGALSTDNKQPVTGAYARLPLRFEANQGQSNARVQFLCRGSGYALFLTSRETVVTLQPGDAAGRGRAAVVRTKLRGANPEPKVTGLDELPGKSHYFIGNNPARWRTNIPTYGRVRYQDVYPGVDLVYYGSQQQLEYDFVVAPGANPNVIGLKLEGADGVEIDSRGDLVARADGSEVRMQKPRVYQEGESGRRTIAARYVWKDQGVVGFEVGEYDAEKPLVIDPVLIYSTYLGGALGSEEIFEGGLGIAADASGNAYVTGIAGSTDFPTTNASSLAGSYDGFVAKFNPSGALIYSTYLGGFAQDQPQGIAADSSGNAYVAGWTTSSNFPTAGTPVQSTFGGGIIDAFVAKLNPTGTLVYSTFLGGSDLDLAVGIAIDGSGNAYVTGPTNSTDFPKVTPAQGTLGGGFDAFVAKLNAAGSALMYSTYLGGSADEAIYMARIAVDPFGNAYAAGSTFSTDFPTTAGVFSPSFNGGGDDLYVAKLNSAGAFVYKSYLGGSGSELGNFAVGIAADAFGNGYVTGATTSSDFPATAGAFDPTFNGGGDAFVTKVNTTGSGLVYSTFLGGSVYETGRGIAVNASGEAYATGDTSSTDFPLVDAVQPLHGGTGSNGFGDVYVTKLNAGGSALVYSTFLGGSNDERSFDIAMDGSGGAYVTGITASINFPTANAFQPLLRGTQDIFVAKISGAACLSPVITGAAADPGTLWPPEHQMVDVTVNYTVTSNCPPTTCTLGVTSNEPINGTGDGDTSPDWVIVDANHVRLRAERAGTGTGRVYAITITCTDSAGQASSQTATVTVPH